MSAEVHLEAHIQDEPRHNRTPAMLADLLLDGALVAQALAS